MSDLNEIPRCELCGEPMPEGETMFKYHGYSGPCPAPRKARPAEEPATIERERAYVYLCRLLRVVSPEQQPLPDLYGVCTQIDNYIASLDHMAMRKALLWCVQHDGECLGDHPQRLTEFRALAQRP
jgi:hypothetical protein